ncbi:MAG: hypothetical protein KDC61_23810, partial [Saprospiraceae bacterium]|nr:hypothetical protein [Saprospiraceae bacterium]
ERIKNALRQWAALRAGDKGFQYELPRWHGVRICMTGKLGVLSSLHSFLHDMARFGSHAIQRRRHFGMASELF